MGEVGAVMMTVIKLPFICLQRDENRLMNNVSDVFIRDHQSLLVVMLSILFQRRFLVQFDQIEATHKIFLQT